jgi:membrane-associated phospholipid phosphatase
MNKLLIISILFLCFHSSFSQNKTIETSGDILLFMMPATALGSTLVIGDKKGTWQFTKGFLVNGVISFGLKSIIDKERPDMSDTNSLPSAHTSTTFQSASFIQKRYGWKYGIPAYVLAGFTGYSRIEADKHDIIDVLAGAVIGVGSTYLFTTPYQQEHMELTYSNSDGNYLIGFRYKF